MFPHPKRVSRQLLSGLEQLAFFKLLKYLNGRMFGVIAYCLPSSLLRGLLTGSTLMHPMFQMLVAKNLATVINWGEPSVFLIQQDEVVIPSKLWEMKGNMTCCVGYQVQILRLELGLGLGHNPLTCFPAPLH